MNANLEQEISTPSLLVPLALMMVIGGVAMYLNILPTGLIGVMCLLFPFALILERFGNWLPVWKTYLGGAPLLLIFIGSALDYYNLIPAQTGDIASKFMKSSGSNFLDFYICGLLVGAILSIDSKILLQAGIRYVVPMITCIIVCVGIVTFFAGILGFKWNYGAGMIAIPILGGGMGGGVVPMTQVIAQAISQEAAEKMVSQFVPAVVLGNVFAIFFAGLLDWFGKKYPTLSGNGQLMKNVATHGKQPENRLTPNNIIIGLVVSTGLYTAGIVLSTLLQKMGATLGFTLDVHNLVLTILIVFVAKVTRCVPDYITDACYTWFRFITQVFTALILLGIGLVYTDLGMVLAAITPTYVFLCFIAVLACVIGAGLGGLLVGFYFVESAITAGLCMANMGGTGDVAVLSASKRMMLMPFARISTSIGGSIVIIICGLFVHYLYGQ